MWNWCIQKRLTKLMSKPSVESFQRFSEDLAAVKMLQPKLVLKRPIYAGMVTLDLAKLLMYNFYYNVLKKKYGDLCVESSDDEGFDGVLDEGSIRT